MFTTFLMNVEFDLKLQFRSRSDQSLWIYYQNKHNLIKALVGAV